MADKAEEAHRIRQNLADAVCPERMIESYMEMWEQGRMADQVDLLRKQRKTLMERLHGCQHALDCLDYLIFTTEKQRQCHEP